MLPEFLMATLRVPSARERLIDSSTQTTNIANISLGRLRPFVVALPPLAEQKRIVAKVDGLMMLCDDLETQLLDQQDLSSRLAISSTRLAD
jgi:type I restriction enzyme S subunit